VNPTRRILVIDDEEMILRLVGSILNTLGYECAKAKDGSKAAMNTFGQKQMANLSERSYLMRSLT
jgi:CheY-like chemotaxis protein